MPAPDQIAAIELYSDEMEQLKARILAVESLLQNRHGLPIRQAVESAALQLRSSLEGIALASLVANRELYAAGRSRFDKEWDPLR